VFRTWRQVGFRVIDRGEMRYMDAGL
jgi:hypothetical protein